jgi:sigma-E factor negative regulatory protein RseA
MSEHPDPSQRRQFLSDLMDGAAEPHAVARACAAWREDEEARADWHAYHLIGDVLRSDDLAQAPARDLCFLSTLRVRLASEPVVLAPAAGAAALPWAVNAVPRRRGWMAPVAVAAGFVAVAGVLVITRVSAPGDSGLGPTLAALPRAAEAQPVSDTVADGKLIRDARLDRYLAAHKQYGNSAALAVPGVVLRSATTVAPER